MKLSQLKSNPNNPRVIKDDKFEKLKKSISEFPKMMSLRPIIVDQNNIVLGGNMRLKALQSLGYKEIPDDWVKKASELTDDEKSRFIVSDNIGFGDWEYNILMAQFDVSELSEWGLDIPKFDNQEDENKEAVDDDYEIPESIKVDVKNGDLIEIGQHKLICGDCCDTDMVKKLMSSELANLVVTDPPYNVDYTGKTKDALKIKNDKMENSGFLDFLRASFASMYLVSSPGAAWYVWHADSEGLNFRQAMFDVGIKVRQCLIWVKNSMVMGRQDYHWKHEPCLYGWKDGGGTNGGPTGNKQLYLNLTGLTETQSIQL